MKCIFCGSKFCSSIEDDKVCTTCERAIKQLGLNMRPDRIKELAQAEQDGRLVVLPSKAKRTPHDEKIDALKSAVWKYCSKFMQMQTYGECRAACPFHAIGNHGQAMCSDRFIEENPEKVAKILGLNWVAEAAAKGADT